jgi:hypothetical protein
MAPFYGMMYIQRNTQNRPSKNQKYALTVLGGLEVSVLATGPKVCRFKPGQGQSILKGDKNPQQCLPLEGK